MLLELAQDVGVLLELSVSLLHQLSPCLQALRGPLEVELEVGQVVTQDFSSFRAHEDFLVKRELLDPSERLPDC